MLGQGIPLELCVFSTKATHCWHDCERLGVCALYTPDKLNKTHRTNLTIHAFQRFLHRFMSTKMVSLSYLAYVEKIYYFEIVDLNISKLLYVH